MKNETELAEPALQIVRTYLKPFNELLRAVVDITNTALSDDFDSIDYAE
jgi:hypothetical protein